MDEIKFLTALSILHTEAKKLPDSPYNDGYKKALYDVLGVSKFCKAEPKYPRT